MREGMISTMAAMFIVGAPVAYAQQAPAGPAGTPDAGRLSQTEFKMLTNVRVGVIRAALQLTSEQEKLWPAEGEVIRSGTGSRYRRLTSLGENMGQGRDVDPVQLRMMLDDLTWRLAWFDS